MAEFVDEQPEDVKQMETFCSSTKWKLLGGHSEDLLSHRHFSCDSPDSSPPRRAQHMSSDISPHRRAQNSSPDTSQPRRTLDSFDTWKLRRARHDSPDLDPSVPHSVPRIQTSKASARASSQTSSHRKWPNPLIPPS